MKHTPSSSRFSKTLVRLAGLALILAVAMVSTGCDKEVQSLEAKEGTRISLDNIFYQVQLSRQLNPKDVEDSYYLQGQLAPPAGESYFGVFMRVDNEIQDTRVMPVGTRDMEITTANGDVFKPLRVKAEGWGYAPAPISKGGMLPTPNSPAFSGTIRGGLILFKIPLKDLDNRPLKLHVKGHGGDKGEIVLDV
jgi:hypothetical protein